MTRSTYDKVKGDLLTFEQAKEALRWITPDGLDRNDWIKVSTGLKAEFGGGALAVFLEWSGGERADNIAVWKSLNTTTATIGSLIHFARQRGWSRERATITDEQEQANRAEAVARQQKLIGEENGREFIRIIKNGGLLTDLTNIAKDLVPASVDHEYLSSKKLHSAVGVYQLPTYSGDNEALSNVKEYKNLIIPFVGNKGAQSIRSCGTKRLLKWSDKKGNFAWLPSTPPVDAPTKTIVIGEGYATVASALQSERSDISGVFAIDAGNLLPVAVKIREQYPQSNIVIFGDNDKSGVGQKKSREASEKIKATLLIPHTLDEDSKSTDMSDLYVALHGKVGSPRTNKLMDDLICGNTSVENLHNMVATNKAVNVRYLGDMLPTKKGQVNIMSLYGTGKTTAIRSLLERLKTELGRTPYLLYVTASAKLNRVTADGLGIAFYENIKETWQGAGHAGVATTVQSLDSVATILMREKVEPDLLIVDESEHTCADFVSDINAKKRLNLMSMSELLNSVPRVIFMDAAMGNVTELFQTTMNMGDVRKIKNTYSPWKDMPCNVYEGTPKDLRASFHAEIEKKIMEGIRVYAPCSSKEEANKLSEYIGKSKLSTVEGFSSILITADNARLAAQRNLINKPERAELYHLIIASPVIGTGISFSNNKNTTTHCCAYIYNGVGTGSPQLAVQSLARERGVSEFSIYLNNDDLLGKDAPRPSDEIVNALLRNYKQVYGISDDTTLSREEIATTTLYVSMRELHDGDKRKYGAVLYDLLDDMGLSVETHAVGRATKGELEAMLLSKEERKDNLINETMNAKSITESEYMYCRDMRRSNYVKHQHVDFIKYDHFENHEAVEGDGEILNNENKIYKYELERDFAIDISRADKETIGEFITLKQNGALDRIENREMLTESKSFWTNSIIARSTRNSGATDRGLSMPTKHSLFSSTSSIIRNGKFAASDARNINKSKTETSFYRYVKENITKIASVLPNLRLNSKKFEANPEVLLKQLIVAQGYTVKKVRNKDEYTITTNAPIERTIVRRKKANVDLVSKIKKAKKGLAGSLCVMDDNDEYCNPSPPMSDATLAEAQQEIFLIAEWCEIEYLSKDDAMQVISAYSENTEGYKDINVEQYLKHHTMRALFLKLSDLPSAYKRLMYPS
jgi:putative DNA primase/helicase